MATVIGVRFKKAGKVYYFDPNDIWPRPGDNVVVETARGMEFGEVVTTARSVSDATLMRERSPLSASSLASAWRRARCERRDRRSHFSSWDKRPPCYSACALLHSASIIAHRVHQHVKAIFGM